MNTFSKWIATGLLTLPLVATAAPHADSMNATNSMQDHMNKRLDRMKSDLELTDEQVQEIRGVFDQHREKMQSLHESMQEDMREILNPEQQKKFAEMHKERDEKMKR